MPASAQSIAERFAVCADRYADRPAVSAPGAEWTYGELDQRSRFIAGEILHRLGPASEPVALLMEHEAPVIAAILGALQAGKIYLALDPGQPRDRLAAVLADSQARLVLTDPPNAALAQSLAAAESQVWEVPDKFATVPPRASLPPVSPAAGAWLMFTSGSTGAPKGVWQNHGGVLHHTEIYTKLTGLAPADRLSLLTSCSFAASATHLFGALLNGAMLCPFPLRTRGFERLAVWLRAQRISVCHSVPAVFRQLARETDRPAWESVRLLRLGGEPVLRGDVDLFRRLAPARARLLHAFSSTETGLICALMLDRQTVLPDGRVPVGPPVPGVDVLLLDEHDRPVPAGGAGKIAVRSAHLCRGYWRRPEATADQFRTDEANPRLRIFRSHDLGRFLPGGMLEHLGRADHLVKIHGQRVEPAEVEAALLATGLAREAVVTVRVDASGETRLAAYLVPPAGAKGVPPNFRRALSAQLPAHMIPQDFVPLEKLPLTIAGKLDRRTLPAPPVTESKKVLSRAQRPRDVIETRVARIWESHLNLAPIARRDDFFDLGGTSLQAVAVLGSLEELFGVALPPSTLVAHSTVEQLAGLLVDHAVIPSPGPLVQLREGAGGRPLFLIHSGQGDVTSYGLLTRRLPQRPIYGLQSVGLQGESWPLMSVPAMARRYLPEILARDPTGPHLLAGTCLGGLIALELAQLLVQQGRTVGLLALLDSLPPPPDGGPLHGRETISDAVRDAFRRLRWSLLRACGLGRQPRWRLAYRRFVSHMNGRANRAYRPQPYPGTLTLFLTAETRSRLADPQVFRRRHARETRLIPLPGNRAGLFIQPTVDELARQLQACLEAADKPPR